MDTENIKEGKNQQKGHVMRVDDDVWKKLDEKALELGIVYASRNQVLRKILGLEVKVRKPGGKPQRGRIAKRTDGRPITR